MRRRIERLALHALSTGPGRRAIAAAVRRDPRLALEPLGAERTTAARFRAVDAWPERLSGFEDLAFLFSSNQLNHGIALLTLDEASQLFRLAREARTIAEIGRFKGGSTLLLATAMPPDGELWSYDLHVKLPGAVDGDDLDRELTDTLVRYGLVGRVHLVVGDSRSAEPPPRPCDLVFVDGDHSYDGTRADYLAWKDRLVPGGHLVFHDFAGATPHEGVIRAVAEVDEDVFERLPGSGSLAVFRRRP
jgi:SAM-dependent methyltransferase